MILSNAEVHRALDDGRLVLDPEPLPKMPDESGPECPYQTSAVDLRLGNEISYFKQGLPVNVDLRQGGFARLFGPNSKNEIITEERPFVLKPGRLVLGKTLERVELPILSNGQSLAARVEGKSSYARCGLLVHFTAPTIHAGFSGTITLELYNLGPFHISLFPGAPICQLIVETVQGVPSEMTVNFKDKKRLEALSEAGRYIAQSSREP